MTTQNQLEQEQLSYLAQEEEFFEKHPLDDYLKADPDYGVDHPLQHKVEMDMAIDAAIGLDHSTLSLPQAFASSAKSGLDFVLKR